MAEVRLTEELLAEANLPDDLARSLFGDIHYRSEALSHALAECGISLVTERTDQHGRRQRIEIALSSLKRVFGLGQTLATTLVGLATRIAAKIKNLHLRSSHQQGVGAPSRSYQGAVGMNLTTHI